MPANTQDQKLDIIVKRLTAAPQTIGALSLLLSDAERARARRFAFDDDARRFVVARAGLRQLLGERLGVPPASVTLERAAQGKPALARQGLHSDLRFNLSHSGDLVVYAFAVGREVGIDVEAIRPMPDADAIAGRSFSRREQTQYRRLDQSQKALGFFTCWTRKEAVLKALGQGLSYPLDGLDVGIMAEDRVAGDHAAWSVQTFVPAPDYVAAVAVAVANIPQALFAARTAPILSSRAA